jgi:hypothetical protein
MRFEVTHEDAQRPATAIIKYFRKRHIKMKIERSAWPDAPYRTTLLGVQSGLHILVEAQGVPNYGGTLKALATWLAASRHYAQFYMATMSDATVQAGALHEMRRDGVGLLVVDGDGIVRETHKARNPALVVNPDPTLKFGTYKSDVRATVEKFNETDRKDGLRDMCELVERLTEEVGVAACRKGWLKTPEAQFRGKDWSGQINELARPEVYNPGRSPLIVSSLKDDLHSFRGARNLVDHPAHGRREDSRRQKQFADRMMQGPRLVAELVAVKRKIK